MLMKRIYKADRLPNGEPELDHVELYDTGTTPNQHFSERLVMKGILEGWVSIKGDQLTLLVQPEPFVYTIVRAPARYCLFCGAKLPGTADDGAENRGWEARDHVATFHAGVTSPDPAWPHGYAVVTSYETALAAAQHAKYRFAADGQPRLRGLAPAHVRRLRVARTPSSEGGR